VSIFRSWIICIKPIIFTAQYQHVAITLHSRQLLKMGTWLPETCWATCKGEIKDHTKVTSSWFVIPYRMYWQFVSLSSIMFFSSSENTGFRSFASTEICEVLPCCYQLLQLGAELRVSEMFSLMWSVWLVLQKDGEFCCIAEAEGSKILRNFVIYLPILMCVNPVVFCTTVSS